jgi:hypothetical protein
MEIQLLAGHSAEKWGAILERMGRNGQNTKTAVRHEATLFLQLTTRSESPVYQTQGNAVVKYTPVSRGNGLC